jgi:hypothetical protein
MCMIGDSRSWPPSPFLSLVQSFGVGRANSDWLLLLLGPWLWDKARPDDLVTKTFLGDGHRGDAP